MREMTDVIPVRTELTVLPADEPKARTIGLPMTTYEGTRIARLVNGKLEEPLCQADDLREGMAIVVTGILGRFEAVVVKNTAGSLCWKTDRAWGRLEFAIDDRGCWTSPGSHIGVEVT